MHYLQTLVVSRVTPRSYRQLQLPPDLVSENKQLPTLNQDPLASNIYSINERILLMWLNFFYDIYRTKLWSNIVSEAKASGQDEAISMCCKGMLFQVATHTTLYVYGPEGLLERYAKLIKLGMREVFPAVIHLLILIVKLYQKV